MIKVSSFQSLGAVDGPGVRFVVFLQGCNLRCKYCHNPETLSFETENTFSEKELFDKIERYDKYIKKEGGVTFSGGEPLLQAKELIPLFKMLKESGYHIALDTNGSILNEDVKELLEYTDLVLLDMKMPDDKLYFEYTKCHIEPVLTFFNYLEKINKKVWIRQVVIEGVNNTEENVSFLNTLAEKSIVERIELLPFKKLCVSKYENMNMKFEMIDFKETDPLVVKELKTKLLK